MKKKSITRLSKDYKNKFLTKIKENFNENQQQLFIASFYFFLNYDKKDFVIDFDNVWKWLGFSRKDPAKRLLEKFFTINIDYKILKAAPLISGAAFEANIQVKKFGGAGLNKETIMLSVNTFKKFCLKADTKKADEVHDYYIKLEELLQETVNEESNELRKQLSNKEEERNKLEEEKLKLEEERNKLLKKYVKNTKEIIDKKNVVYLMTTSEAEKVDEYIIGKALDLSNRKEDYNHNKLHDFKIIYYKTCPNAKLMDIIEASVLMKLSEYRCKAGRDVFLLPKPNDISFFTNVFDECLKFYENVSHVIYPKRTLEKEDKDSLKERSQKYREDNKDKLYQQQKEYREDNKEIISELKKEYYEKNKEMIAEKNKKYYEENKQNVIDVNMEYYENNKEIILEERKEYYQKNKEKILEERNEYYNKNYKTKIAVQRAQKEKCECGMVISHACMTKHKKTDRHKKLLEKILNIK